LSVLAQSAAIVVTGAMACELGGGRVAQVAAALAVALSPLPLFEGTEFQYTTFDYLWSVTTAYFVIRLLKAEHPRWWLAIGATMGLGFMTKYTIVFLAAGLGGGLLLTRDRHYVTNRWFWAGAAVAGAIFLPNLMWQAHHGFVSLEFLRHIHVRDVGQGRANGFLRDQFLICANLFAVPMWIAGLVSFCRLQRYRLLAWMYVIPLALFLTGKGRGYYMAGAYPALIAMGAAASEKWVLWLPRWGRRTLVATFFIGVVVCGMYACALVLPIAPSGPLRDFALEHSGDLREEIGWHELVQTVAEIRDSLPANERLKVGVLVGNYGEQGAVEILGPAYKLPRPMSGTNSAWLRWYPDPPPSTLIVIGFSHVEVARAFISCRLAGHNTNSLGVKNEESQRHPDIFVCGPPRLPWPEFWTSFRRFG
jgi:4-amino-4-deoxy-L-arabinose transferase-like glycosyltransferase